MNYHCLRDKIILIITVYGMKKANYHCLRDELSLFTGSIYVTKYI
ncbi:hypothetical protein CRENPOLYSF1_820006 [Crenothrix polyspora]|uniref:Uncharacterized protein n=1 Tax=Crenothrix polyspora TaxID=360316 RepID=A0A1R4HJA7_9GAMM|nr:hypothetical protein CRENPOLYSF1_820006 [Crenothrix polyspora]